MKLLMIFCKEFSFHPSVKTLEDAPVMTQGNEFQDALIAFIHAEEADEQDFSGIEKKLVKNLKWAAKKNNTLNVVLHSFAHLSHSKATPKFTLELFNKVEERMKNAGYQTSQTAFGYFMDLTIKAPGYSQARIFTSF